MKIIAMVAENFKRLRLVEIEPKGRVVQITGRNGQGKTSVVDAVWATLAGARAMPEKPVRKGSAGAVLKLLLGTTRVEVSIKRTISSNGSSALTVETADGTKVTSPQAMLDDLMGTVSIDPLEFLRLKPQQQIEQLRRISRVDFDFDAAEAENKRDFEERTIVNRDVKRLEVELSGMVAQDGLPAEKVETADIVRRLNDAGAENKRIEREREAIAEAGRKEEQLWQKYRRAVGDIELRKAEIQRLERELAEAKGLLAKSNKDAQKLEKEAREAQAECEAKVAPEYVDVAALTRELQEAELVNREIERAERRGAVAKLLQVAREKSNMLTRGMEARLEAKQSAIATANLPVEGLIWDDASVLYNGIPMEQLGEAEQIRVSAQIAMAGNSKLRVLRILHGESMDEDSMAELEKLAEQNDYQIWMAKVDTSGKVGIVLEDGMVVKSEAE